MRIFNSYNQRRPSHNKFGEIKLPENSSISYFDLKNLISAKKNDLYSKEKIRLDINSIKDRLGEVGYMYPNIYPKIKKNKRQYYNFSNNNIKYISPKYLENNDNNNIEHLKQILNDINMFFTNNY